jgi:hypothetical protein
MADHVSRQLLGAVACVAVVAGLCLARTSAQVQPAGSADNTFNDSHFHLTNYVQKGTDVRKFLEIMGTRVGRSTLFGIPLQQQWSYANSGDFAPTYYLQTDAPLYYYSFTDAYIASVYRSLSPAEQARFDPMITGFNPADMYGVDHIRRVLQVFPGVFSGIGEFSIQGVRLVEGVGRDREPDQPGARSHPRLRGRSRPRRDSSQRHRMPFAKENAEPRV